MKTIVQQIKYIYLILILFLITTSLATAGDKCTLAVNQAIEIINNKKSDLHPSDFHRGFFGNGGGRQRNGITTQWLNLNKSSKYRSCKKNIVLEFTSRKSFNIWGKGSDNRIVNDIIFNKIQINPDGGKYYYNYSPERDLPLKIL